MKLNIAILAAGEGKRMHSSLPKVLHRLAGKSLLEHVVTIAQQLNAAKIFVVYNGERKQVRDELNYLPVTWVEQPKPLGTGHAAQQVLPLLNKDVRLLVLCGDVPLISKNTLKKLLDKTTKNAVGWLTADVKNPFGLGRIVRDKDKKPIAIVEEKDASTKQKNINEINAGICLVSAPHLKKWLPKLKNNNAQSEYYLTDLFAMAVADNVNIVTTKPNSEAEILGINDNKQLAIMERIYQQQIAEEYMEKGLTLLDPDRFDVRGELTFGKDVVIDISVIIEGNVSIGNNCYIGPNVYLKDATIADNVKISANTVIDSAVINNDCSVGPFARLRPETKLQRGSKVGNFVEIKKSEIGEKSKVNHLSYIGDTVMGKNVNIGAGTITCNYDGVNKHKTVIEDEVFIGSNSQLVAPLTIGIGATIGAGSTITTDAPANKLTLARAKQITIEDWKKPKKPKVKSQK